MRILIIAVLSLNFSILYSQVVVSNSILSGEVVLDISIKNSVYNFNAKYRSGNNSTGILGLGISTDLEKRISAIGDGTLILESSCDCQGQNDNYSFVPLNWNFDNIDSSLIKTLSKLPSDIKKEDLLHNFSLRRETIKKLIETGKWKIPFYEKKYYAFESPSVILEVLDNGFKYQENGKSYFFDSKGVLKEIEENNKKYRLDYNSSGQLISVRNSKDSVLKFIYNEQGKLAKISDSNNDFLVADYSDDKISRIRLEKNNFRIKFDTNNLISEFLDVRFQDLHHFKFNKENWLIFNKNEDIMTHFLYHGDLSQRKKNVKIESIELKDLYENTDSTLGSYEIVLDINSLGKVYLKSFSSKKNGIYASNSYTQAGTCQISEKKSKQNTTYYSYNERGLLNGKHNGNGFWLKIERDPTTQKVVHVYSSSDRANWFLYDEKGNLVFAEDNMGHRLELLYDEEGKISVMISKDKIIGAKNLKILNFRYNSIGKPSSIMMEGTGILNINYDHNGEITKVESPSGHQLALEITQAFQNMNQLAKPVGVNFQELTATPGDNKFEYESKISEGLIAAGIDGKWGYKDSLGNWKIAADFDHCADFSEGWGIIRKNQKFGALSYRGDFLLPAEYDFISEPKNGYVRFKKNGLWGIMDIEGKEILKPKYNYLFDMDEDGYAKVLSKGKWNRINLKAEVLFDIGFDRLSPWDKGYWLAESDNKSGLYDAKGKSVLNLSYERLEYADDQGIFVLKKENHWFTGKVSENSVSLSDTVMCNKLSVSDRIITVENNNRKLFGLLNSEGRIIVKAQYDNMSKYYGNRTHGGTDTEYFRIEKNNSLGFLNSKGDIILPAEYEEKSSFLIGKGQYCFYNLKNDSIYLNCYDSLYLYQEFYDDPALYAAKKNGLWGIVQMDENTAGHLNEILPFEYRKLVFINSQLAITQKKKGFELLNLHGNKTVVKNIKSFSKIENYNSNYILNLNQGKIFISNYGSISQKFSEIKGTDSDLFIVKIKNRYGLFSIENYQLAAAVEYDKISEENGVLKGFKKGKETILYGF